MIKSIHTELAPQALGTYSQAIKCGDTVYLSGQIPLDPATAQLCSDEIRIQIDQVIKNLAAVCEASGGSLSNVVKLTVYLLDLAHFPLINDAMAHHFTEPYPARTTFGVVSLPRGAQVEMDAIMVVS